MKAGDRVIDITPVIDGLTYWAKQETNGKKRAGKAEVEAEDDLAGADY